MKRLSDVEINAYLATGDWQGKAGGYAIQGPAGAFHPLDFSGSFTGIVGPAFGRDRHDAACSRCTNSTAGGRRMKGRTIILDHIKGREAAALIVDGKLDDFLIESDAPRTRNDLQGHC